MARVKRLSRVKCTCVVCGKSFKALRSDAKYCKSPCTAYDARKAEIAPSATIVPDGHILEFNASETRGIAGANLGSEQEVGQRKRLPVKRVRWPKVRHQYYDENRKPKPWPHKAKKPLETVTIYEGEEMYRLPRNSRQKHPHTYIKGYLRYGEPGSVAWNEQAIPLPMVDSGMEKPRAIRYSWRSKPV